MVSSTWKAESFDIGWLHCTLLAWRRSSLTVSSDIGEYCRLLLFGWCTDNPGVGGFLVKNGIGVCGRLNIGWYSDDLVCGLLLNGMSSLTVFTSTASELGTFLFTANTLCLLVVTGILCSIAARFISLSFGANRYHNRSLNAILYSC